MKKVELRPMEDTKYKIIKNLVDNDGNKFRAAEILNLSILQINRLILKYKTSGKSSFIHGNRDWKPINTIDIDAKEKISLEKLELKTWRKSELLKVAR